VRRQELANAEKLFDLPITKYDGLIEVDSDLRNMTKVYELYKAQKVH
jgi:dynein heavy chain